jgi:hypothetical protein
MSRSAPRAPAPRHPLLDPTLDRLSPVERDQLGTHKPLQNGTVSPFRYVPAEYWPSIRGHLLTRSRRAAARGCPDTPLAARMTAYTPGETLHLLQEPAVVAWHRRMATFDVPACDAQGRPYERIAFVPCAKTKPWDTATTGLYGSYNAIRAHVRAGRLPPVYFVTISEPLGIVPEAHWGDFPQYDNPGLFTNEVLRSGGLMTADWPALTPAGEKFIIPFDPAAYATAIATLGGVIANFMRHTQQRRPELTWVSFVENMDASLSTHGDMLNHATAAVPVLAAADRHAKKAETRIPPTEHIANILGGRPAPAKRRGARPSR